MTKCNCGNCESHQELGPEALRLLEEHHQFPGPYMFKVIGFNGPDFQDSVVAAAETVLGVLEDCGSVRNQASSGGKYLSVTLDVEVSGSGQVLEIYAALRTVQGIVALV